MSESALQQPDLPTFINLEEQMVNACLAHSREQAMALLHELFLEIGRSGQQYNRDDVIADIDAGKPWPVSEFSRYEAAHLAEDTVLLTYRSLDRGEDGKATRYSLRSSIWVKSKKRWQMRFHQGTPVPAWD